MGFEYNGVMAEKQSPYDGRKIFGEGFGGEIVRAEASNEEMKRVDYMARAMRSSDKFRSVLDSLNEADQELVTTLTAAFAIYPGDRFDVVRGVMLRKATDENKETGDNFSPFRYLKPYPVDNDSPQKKVRDAVVEIAELQHEEMKKTEKYGGMREVSGEEMLGLVDRLAGDVDSLMDGWKNKTVKVGSSSG